MTSTAHTPPRAALVRSAPGKRPPHHDGPQQGVAWILPAVLLGAVATTGPFIAPVAANFSGAADSEQVLVLDSVEQQRAGIRTALSQAAATLRNTSVVGEVVPAPSSTREIRSPVEGRIEQLAVAPGDRVEVGQLLMVLHSHEIHRHSTDLRIAQREVEMAKNRFAAGEQLYEIEGISRLELERREQEVLRAELAVENTMIELEDLGMSHTEIEQLAQGALHGELPVRASLAGVVLEVAVTTAARVQSWQPLLVIGDPEGLELALQVPPSLAGEIQAGDEVRFAPVGLPLCCSARVLTRVPQIDPMTRTVTIRATIDPSPTSKLSGRTLLPGLFVEGRLISRRQEEENHLALVPAAAVIRLADRDVVFVDQGAGRFVVQPVQLGAFDGTSYEVLEGLRPGVRIVVEGVFLLKSKLMRDSVESTEPGSAPDDDSAPGTPR